MAIVEDRGVAECEEELVGLKKRLESLAVIEQAKGMLMAREGCDPDEAFGMLRRASQRENEKVRAIAARIVTNASRLGGGSVQTPTGNLLKPPPLGG